MPLKRRLCYYKSAVFLILFGFTSIIYYGYKQLDSQIDRPETFQKRKLLSLLPDCSKYDFIAQFLILSAFLPLTSTSAKLFVQATSFKIFRQQLWNINDLPNQNHSTIQILITFITHYVLFLKNFETVDRIYPYCTETSKHAFRQTLELPSHISRRPRFPMALSN